MSDEAAGRHDLDPARDHRGSVGLPRACLASVPAGVLATVTMDAALVAASSLGGTAFTSSRLGVDMIGRWVTDLARGQLRHDDITSEPARRGEVALGMLTHYGTGIGLTLVFTLLPHRALGRSNLVAGTAFGIATSALPLLLMFPSMGYGWMGLRSGDAARLNRIMLLGHAAFGIGIGVWAPRFASTGSATFSRTAAGSC